MLPKQITYKPSDQFVFKNVPGPKGPKPSAKPRKLVRSRKFGRMSGKKILGMAIKKLNK